MEHSHFEVQLKQMDGGWYRLGIAYTRQALREKFQLEAEVWTGRHIREVEVFHVCLRSSDDAKKCPLV